ncbi:IS4 family transposase [Nonomuraea sp. NBC_00507]|uniref:IS4 family transposase n=1 Tax=Nonomuraea sp. NBC_00507 TaxID=2976002 RepID=UPI002E17BD56
MHDQCVITAHDQPVSVPASVFAPGHLGALTRFLPAELVDAILEETRTQQKRLRHLPSRVGVYFMLALALFPSLGYTRVWDKLVAGLRPAPVYRPSEKALRDLRRRLGPAPLKALFEVLAGPLAQPKTPGVCYRRWRTVAFDGCTSIKVPDRERNRGWLGKVSNRLGWVGYPTVLLMTLCETGTRGLLGAVFGARRHDETFYARKLLPLLSPQMLLLADRAFDTNGFLSAVADTGAQFLVRLNPRRRPAVMAVLPDGSYLTRLGTLQIRIIDATLTATTAADNRICEHYRLATTLLDHRSDPADVLVRLYHERWEVESAYLALRHTLQNGRVLRSSDPVGLEQELWAQLVLYQALRVAMVEAVESIPGTDPDRASFTIALETARDSTIIAHTSRDETPAMPVGAIGRAVLAELLPKRRARTSVRKVKAPMSRYSSSRDDTRPPTSQTITSLTIDIHDAANTPPITPAHQDQRRVRRGAGRTGDGPRNQTFQLMRAEPQRVWQLREIAQALGYSNIKSFATLLGLWTSEGLLRRVSRGFYTLATADPAQT